MKVSDYVVNFLAKQGVKDVFMFVGGGSMHLNDSVGLYPEINYIACLHEQACAIAAESYARCKNDIGVAIVTTGPGATNTLTALAAAWIESTQLFIISGQVKRSDSMIGTGVRQMGVQEVDIVSMAKPITKYSVLLTEPLKIRYELEKCIHIAKEGRPGPILLDIPLDVQASHINENELEGYSIPQKENYINPNDLNKVKYLIQKAKRPVIYAGAGVYFSNGQNELIQLIEKLNIPILTTWNGIDLIWEDHPLYMGRPGAIGQRAANFIIQNADLLITIGTRLSSLQTGFNYPAFAKNAKIIMVDIDQSELNKEKLNPHIKICCDAKLFIEKLLQMNIIANNNTRWLNICKQWNQKYPVLNPQWLNENSYANSYYLVDAISKYMKSEDIYCGGRAGTCVDTIIHAFKVKKGQKVIATKGLSSMGYGLPAAIGAAIAFPHKKIVCNNGDGGFVMNIQELATVKRLNLPIKFFILNNGGYATIVATQTNVFNKHFVGCTPDSGLTLGNICKIAESYGIKTFRINNNDEIENTVKAMLEYEGPSLCDVKISIKQPIQPRQANYKTPEGQMASRPLEDMNPILDRKELEKIMSISN